MPNSAPDRPASHEERVRTIDVLRTAGAQLGLEELDIRLNAAVAAKTAGELAVLVWDINETPAPLPAPKRKRSVWQNMAFRLHAAAYGLTNSLLVGTWALTGEGFFWPFFPIAGWGIGLGMHAVTVHSWQQKHANKGEPKPRALAPVAPVPPAAFGPSVTQRSVVAMFTDIVDSTRLTAVIGDADWVRVRTRCRDMLHECYAAHHGIAVNSQGDGFLARFASPVEAVRCGVEIQRRLEQQRMQTGFAPAVRVGIHAGDVVEDGGDILGTVVNVAARVMSEAKPGEILTTETVADRLDDRFELEDGGLRMLKGLSRPWHVLSVAWVN